MTYDLLPMMSPLDPLTHFFLYMLYNNSIDLNQIYQIVYNLEWVYMFLMKKSFLQSLYTLQYMIFYPWCRPLDQLTHFFLYMFYYKSIDLNQIYQIVYNLQWVYMFLMNKSFLRLLYTLWDMIFHPWCPPLDQLTHFFLYIFYYNSIDRNQIYQIVYNLVWVYMFVINKIFLQLLYTIQYMIFYPWCRPLDPLIHFFLYMFYYNSIDLNQIYQIVYNLEWVYMFLLKKSFLQLLYTLWHMIFYQWCRH